MRSACEPHRRRELLLADVDRYDAARGMWSGEPASSRLCDAVREAVASALTDKQRAVVEACFFEGLSQEDAARRLGVTQQVVSKTLYGAARHGRRVGGAMRKLREALSPMLAELRAANP